nr:hypothetical protein [Moorella glycerini]
MLSRKMPLIVILAILLWSFGLISNPSFAQNALPSPPAEEKSGIGIESLQLIAFYGSQISQVGSEAKVMLEGYTTTQSAVDYIAVRIYLQKWDGYNWVDVISYPFEDYFTSYVEGVYYYPVQRGYYYRAKGLHLARDGAVAEETISYTASIKIQ